MRRWWRAITACAALLVAGTLPSPAQAAGGPVLVGDPTSLVNPFIGTGSGGQVVGSIDEFPGASMPFGMLSWSPDTPSRPAAGGYYYNDNSTIGLSVAHVAGAGCDIAGDLPILPTVGAIGSNPAATTEPFSHSNEQASPGYYATKLGSDASISAQVAATTRTGIGQFGFPSTTQANMLFKAGDSQGGNSAAGVSIVGNNEVAGSISGGHFCGTQNTETIYFTATFNRPFASYGTWNGTSVTPGARTTATHGPLRTPQLAPAPGTSPSGHTNPPPGVEAKGSQNRTQVAGTSGPKSGAWVTFDTTQQSQIGMKVAISYVSQANASANLAAEDPGWSVSAVAHQTRAAWRQLLSRIRIGGGTHDQQVEFYTALYHALLGPTVFSDANGQYLGFDNKVHTLPNGKTQYTTFSGWDIYRSEVPLLAALAPEQTSQMMDSLVNDEEQGGWLPKWPVANGYTGVMNGDAADPIITEAYRFGARDFDAKAALAAMIKGATVVPTSSQLGQGYYTERPQLDRYQQLGYVPNTSASSISPVNNGVSETLEYATADFSIGEFADALGQHSTAQTFWRRSQNWTNLFNPATGYLQPRDNSGNFPVGDPLTVGMGNFGQSGYQEGNAAQYNWMVPQNLGGLIDAMGGEAAVDHRLDSFFQQLNVGPNEPYYWAGNEIDLLAPWVYDYAGEPYKTQATVHKLLTSVYSDSPGGEPGNDDVGAMSSWFVWASLGMYPQTPGATALALGAPIFPAAQISLPGGGHVSISAPGASTSSYVQSLKVNGRTSTKDWLPISALTSGSGVDFTLGSAPNTGWGAAPQDAPPSAGYGEVPAIGFLTSMQATVAPGGATTVTIAAQNVTGSPQTVEAGLSAPPGITVTPSSGSLHLPAAGQAELSVTVHADASTPQTFYAVPIKLTAGGSTLPGLTLTVKVVRPGTLLDAFNNAGISNDTAVSAANFDNDGNSYSAQALATAGVTAGHTVTVGGLAYSWPLPDPGYPDNASAAGQQVTLNAPTGTQQIGFLGSATDGPSQGIATLTYADGSTARYWVGLSDWTLNAGKAKPSFGNQIAATLPYRNCSGCSTGRDNATTYVYSTSLPVDPAKTLSSVMLPPTATQGQLHIFAIATSTQPLTGAVLASVIPATASAGQQVTVTGSGFGTSQGSGYLTFSDLGTTWGAPGSNALTLDSWSDSKITFTVPQAGAQARVWAGTPASVTVTNASGQATDTAALEITPTASMSDYYDNTAISPDDNQSCANMDGQGYSLSADALATAGASPGSTVTSGGVTFTWPNVPSCQADNVLAAGQTILLPQHSGAGNVGLLVTSTNGASQGTVTVTYTDGTTVTAPVAVTDWAGTATPPENTAITIPYRNSAGGTSQQLPVSVFEINVPVNPAKNVASVTLPDVGTRLATGSSAMHVFAVGLG
ncbi:GH92 family glycosyl hydrolase [Streptomyces sp. RB6PN25]|uniref:GH92 family glycosyl hydrolase n=1 Tax=Streptomyces humicola TaxID=2953240 RepID=A0ABT1PP42_9ACTN|nr:GH92 family glycosyl hydrolase [Streptomyces humicola]MCQ4079440.1 GH92 family glycosyl hydrolase [Streptomyces humicola]